MNKLLANGLIYKLNKFFNKIIKWINFN
jgi:hypothetical protein